MALDSHSTILKSISLHHNLYESILIMCSYAINVKTIWKWVEFCQYQALGFDQNLLPQIQWVYNGFK